MLVPLWVVIVALYVDHAERLANRDQAISKVAGIVVLTGGNGRLQKGVQLLQQKVASRLLITGVSAGLSLPQILPDAPQDLICCIDLGHQAEDTLGNARETRRWLQQQGLWDQDDLRIIIVSAHYHLPRALLQYRKLMPDIDWVGVAVEPEDFPLQGWYKHALGWRLFSIELLKYLWVTFNA